MSEELLSQDLIWKWKWWWDPAPIEIFKNLEREEQREFVIKTIEANAAIAQIQADTLKSLAAVTIANQRCER
jgi:hypothetical protein